MPKWKNPENTEAIPIKYIASVGRCGREDGIDSATAKMSLFGHNGGNTRNLKLLVYIFYFTAGSMCSAATIVGYPVVTLSALITI